MQHRAELENPRVAAAAATKTPFPSGGAKRHKEPARKGGRQSPPRGAEGGEPSAARRARGNRRPPTRSPGAAQGKASEDAPQRAEPRPGKGRGDQRGQSTAAERKGARRAHGSTLAQSEERRPRREGQGERGNARHPGAGAGRPPEPQRRLAMASRTRGGDGTSRTPARGAYIFMPCSRHRAAQGAGRKGALPPKRTDECAPSSRTSPQNDAEQQHGQGVAALGGCHAPQIRRRLAAALAACRRAVGISST